MIKTFLISSILIFAISCSERASASDMEEGEVRGVIGFFLNRLETAQAPVSSPDQPTDTRKGGTFGIQVGLTESISADLEISFAEFEFVRRVSNGLIREKSNRVHVPLLIRTWLADFFSVGAGFYGSYQMGEVEVVQGNNRVVNDTSAADVGEHGLELSLMVDGPIPLIDGWGAFFEYRRSYSLTPRPDEARDWNWLFIGLYTEI